MEVFNRLFEKGLTYSEYLAAGPDDRAASFSVYLENAGLEQLLQSRMLKIRQKVRMLVFCDINCNDCRITLAVMEKMRQVNPYITFRIVNRDENRSMMEQLLNCIRIPQIVIWGKSDFKVIYNEYPDVVHKSLKDITDEEKLMMIVKYRHGAYNNQIASQLLEGIEMSLL